MPDTGSATETAQPITEAEGTIRCGLAWIDVAAGRFEAAATGTLLLDEIGDLPASLQAKLLRVLEDGVFRRVGATREIRNHARVLATTNRDLEAQIAAGKFREDLFYRLNVVEIHRSEEHTSELQSH